MSRCESSPSVPPCDHPRRFALHLYRLADLDRGVVVFAGRSRNGLGPIRPWLRDQHVLHDGPLSDDHHRHGYARYRRLHDERARPNCRRLPDGMARARARTFGALAVDMRPPAPTSTRGHILIEDVVKIYDSGGAAVLAVDHCTLEIEAGEICMIVGPSGCGKTTLLNAIAGFHEITSGRIVMDGEVLCSTEKPMSNPGPDRIVVFQNGALFPWKSNLENVIFGPVMQGRLGRSEAIDKGRAMLADAGLSGVEHNYPGEMSSGVRRRDISPG